MKILKPYLIAFGGLLAAASLPADAAVVGKVIALAGEATALRQGTEVKLTLGAPVESGDLLKIGAPGNLQVRFNDAAIVALRSNTQLRIDNYAFANQPESDTSVFSLLKGGMRTITGVIGRLSRSNYAVNTPTSTIGIRGTHYTLVQCDNDCLNTDGSTAPNGTFGGVTDGRIGVTNEAGDREFGRNQFFYVASRATLPEALMAPPSFLRDRLEGQARATGKRGGSAATGEEMAGDATVGDATAPVQAIASPLAQTTNLVASEQPLVTETVVNPFIGYTQFATAGASSYSAQAFANNTLLLPSDEQAAEVERLKTVYPLALAYSTDLGYSAEAGQVHWGRWYGADGSMPGTGEHWAVGDPTLITSLPTTGIYTYNWIGGTNPTDAAGNVGKVTSGGSLAVDFTGRTVSTLSPLSWIVAGNAYSLSVADMIWGMSGTGTKTLTCDGCTSSSVDVQGNFTGATGEGIIAGIYTTATFAGGMTQETASAQVYGRYTAPPDSPVVPEPPTGSGACTSYPCTYSGSYVDAEAYRSTYTYTGSTPYTHTGTYSWASSGASTVTWYSEPATEPTQPGYTHTYTSSGDIEAGSDPVANLHWARYSWTSISEGPDYTSTTEGWGHHMEGDPIFTLPASGIYTYNHIGGTSPTDAYGNVGTLTSGGSWTVNFTDKSVATAAPVTWTLGGISYSLSVPTQVLTWQTDTYSQTSFTSTSLDVNPITNFNLSCGANCTPVVAAGNGNVVAPWFFGANAEALGVGYSTVVEVGGVTHNTSHVQAYKR